MAFLSDQTPFIAGTASRIQPGSLGWSGTVRVEERSRVLTLNFQFRGIKIGPPLLIQ